MIGLALLIVSSGALIAGHGVIKRSKRLEEISLRVQSIYLTAF